MARNVRRQGLGVRCWSDSEIASNDYHFATHWRVEALIEDVYRIISNATDLPRWRPSVHLDVREILPGDKKGIGKVVSLYTRG